MVSPYRPLDQFLDIEVSIVSEAELAGERTVIVNLLYGKKCRHDIEEVVVVLPKQNRLEGDPRQHGFENRGKLALGFPILCRGSESHDHSLSRD